MHALVSALVSAADLRAELASPTPPVLMDVQWVLTGAPGPVGRERYAAAHLPGATWVDLDTELAGPVAVDGRGGRHPLPDPAVLETALRRSGVRAGGRVVVYDQGPGFAAARAWWVLRWAGVEDVRVLDGGLTAWTAAGGATTTDVPATATGDVTVRAGSLPVLDAASAAEVARDGVLVDARAAERFSGSTEPIDPVAGHVPGAVNAPTTDNAGADGRLLPADELRNRFSSLGIQADGPPVGVYCGSGVTAAHELLALHEAGIDATLYVGSWSDWVSDPDRPVATLDSSM
ncbi:sulfurtransferase [Pedococcus aerophilus]|uniref:Sulfurtransferase n=1 Tax=Pedococcus aerophilus TaxID=436356 RepID=A0ABN3UVI0_9MICO